MKTILALSAAAVIVVGGVVLYVRYRNADPPLAFRTVPIKKGDIVALVSATGTLEPQDTVDVGSQVTGPIAEARKRPKGSEQADRLRFGGQRGGSPGQG